MAHIESGLEIMLTKKIREIYPEVYADKLIVMLAQFSMIENQLNDMLALLPDLKDMVDDAVNNKEIVPSIRTAISKGYSNLEQTLETFSSNVKTRGTSALSNIQM